MDYSFSAPLYLDFDNPEKDQTCLEPLTSDDDAKSEVVSQRELSVSVVNEVVMPESEIMPLAEEPRPTKQNECSAHHSTSVTRQSSRLSAIAKSLRRSNASKGFVSTSRASSGIIKAHRRSLSEGSKVTGHRRIALGKSGMSALSKEEISNLEQTTRYQQILTSNRQRNNMTTMLKGSDKNPRARSGPLKTTKPLVFHFATDSRIKSKENVNKEISENFQRSLRSGTSSSNPALLKGTTKVQPFNLHNSKPKEVGQPFISLAELNLKFQTKTPQRFRTKKYGLDVPILPEPNKTRDCPTELIQPHTPRLATKKRSRPVNHPTREELEQKELEEAQKHQFKAQPLNKKILDKPTLLKPDDSYKQSTVPQPFNITDMKKTQVEKSMDKTLMDMCSDMLSSNSCLTPIPHGGISSSWEKGSTKLKPFSFDSRDNEMFRKKKENIKMVIKEEQKKAEFHAQPMPLFDTVKGLPSKKPPTPTKLQPFNLRSDSRGLARQIALQRQLEALEEVEREHRKFTAQPDTVLRKQPFIPEKSNKSTTDVSGFSLNTDRRAQERKSFDEHLKHVEDELRAKKLELEERKRIKEEVEIQEMRKNAVHIAQPIRHYKPVEIKHGVLPSTIPVSPAFSTGRRLRTRAMSEDNCNVTSSIFINSTCDMSARFHVDGTFNID